MKNLILYVWQLPQHLLALLLIKVLKAVRGKDRLVDHLYLFKSSPRMNLSGFSLGNYILLPGNALYSISAIKHELGHSAQSRYLGPLYLLLVDIPSAVFNNLWDKLFHKNWSQQKRCEWYYSRYPENWADRLGGVDR